MKKMTIEKIQEVGLKELSVKAVEVEEDCVTFELVCSSSYTLGRCKFPYYTIHPSPDGCHLLLIVHTKF